MRLLADDQGEVECAWEAEIERRLEEYRAGKVQTIPAADVLSEARRRLG